MTLTRVGTGIVGALALSLAAPSVAYAQTAATCVDAHEKTQRLRKSNKLRAAMEQAKRCAAEACPASLKRECLGFVKDIERDSPSIAIRVQEDGGGDRTDVMVVVDGEMVAESLSGRAIPVDPGKRQLRLVVPGHAPIARTVDVPIRQKSVPVEVTLPKRAKPAPGPSPSPSPTPTPGPGPATPTETSTPVAAWVVGGVGVASLGLFGAMAGVGWSERGDLDACSPNCSDDQVDPVRTKLLVADIALGVGAAAIVTSAVLFLTAGGEEEEGPVSVDAAVSPNGGFGTLRLRF